MSSDSLGLLFDGDTGIVQSKNGIAETQTSLDHELIQTKAEFTAWNGFIVLNGQNTVTQDVLLCSEQEPPMVSMYFNLKGAPRFSRRTNEHVGLSDTAVHGIRYLPQTKLEFELNCGVQYEVFEVNISQEQIQELSERFPESIGVCFKPILQFERFEMCSNAAFATPAMTATIGKILRSGEHGPARRMFLEAEILELLSLQLLQYRSESQLRQQKTELRPRDIDRMLEARQILFSRMQDPPGLKELAHAIGSNEFNLKRDYKRVFGTTVYESLLKHRMDKAECLLRDTELTIDRIAEEVGYSSGAHFCQAFKREYGYTPSHLRRTAE